MVLKLEARAATTATRRAATVAAARAPSRAGTRARAKDPAPARRHAGMEAKRPARDATTTTQRTGMAAHPRALSRAGTRAREARVHAQIKALEEGGAVEAAGFRHPLSNRHRHRRRAATGFSNRKNARNATMVAPTAPPHARKHAFCSTAATALPPHTSKKNAKGAWKRKGKKILSQRPPRAASGSSPLAAAPAAPCLYGRRKKTAHGNMPWERGANAI